MKLILRNDVFRELKLFWGNDTFFGWKVVVPRRKFDDFHVWRPLSAPFRQIYFPSSEKTLKKHCVFDTFFWAPRLCPESPASKVGVLSARETTFLQNITFYLHERQLFNIVFDDYPCKLPEGTAEAHGQGPAAALCWGPWKSGWDHPAPWRYHHGARTPPTWTRHPAVRWPLSIKYILPYVF